MILRDLRSRAMEMIERKGGVEGGAIPPGRRVGIPAAAGVPVLPAPAPAAAPASAPPPSAPGGDQW